jgi:amidophosphoribosyltransferase
MSPSSAVLGDVAVGHTRYSTAGSSVLANAQPLLIDYRGGPLTIAHNGNLTNAPELRRELADQGAIFTTTTDTEVLLHLIARSRKHTPEEQIREALEKAEGAYTLLMSVGRTIYVVIDSRGFRPAVLGSVERAV